jgi:hypothetical protein
MVLCIHYPIRLHGVVLNYLSTAKILPFFTGNILVSNFDSMLLKQSMFSFIVLHSATDSITISSF